MKENLDQREIEERIAILRRFRYLLEQQRDKFQEYLRILEMQESEINADNADAIIAHADLGNQIVKNIGSLQKIIVPMQKLYEKSHASTYNPEDIVPVTKIQDDLVALRAPVVSQNIRNQKLLRVRMLDIRRDIDSMKNPYRSHRSVYARQDDGGSLVHLEA
ncbi:MAG: flagellar biosynthesis protein FlgN [Treponema sp.]|nr:flagellar biosynthesis protein FlgN [Treponema sp.]